MSLSTILFIVVMLHLAVGFGWALYKIEGKGKKSAAKNKEQNDQNTPEA